METSASKIICLIDCQNDFITGNIAVPNGENISKEIKKFIENSHGVFFVTKYNHLINPNEEQNILTKYCIKDSWGWHFSGIIEAALTNKVVYPVIESNSYGKPKLIDNIIDHIDNFNLDEREIIIELVGFNLETSIISNALMIRSYFPNIKIIVNINCCGINSEEKRNEIIDILKENKIDFIV